MRSRRRLSIWFNDGGFTEPVRAFIGFRKPANLSKDKGLCDPLISIIGGGAVDHKMSHIFSRTYLGFSFQKLQLQDNVLLLHQLLMAAVTKARIWTTVRG